MQRFANTSGAAPAVGGTWMSRPGLHRGGSRAVSLRGYPPRAAIGYRGGAQPACPGPAGPPGSWLEPARAGPASRSQTNWRTPISRSAARS